MTPDTPPQPETTPETQAPVDPSLPSIPGYDIERLIGRGGMGRVYKARHRGLNRVVAIKLLIGAGDDPQLVTRFEHEAKAVASLQHPNIAQIFDSGTANGAPYYAMEYVPGGTLADALAGKPLPPSEAARVAEAIARGMQHAHEHGIIHRDLKPGNILLSESAEFGVRNSESQTPSPANADTPGPGLHSEFRIPNAALLKVADFGLAKRFADDTKITRTGEILGTPSYMAPEQASGVVAKVGPAADVYAVGAILYECLTGRPPFVGIDAVTTILQALTLDPVPPRRLQPKLPADLETVCLKCLEKIPRKRYASAGDLAADLRRFLDGSPIVARPVSAWERAWKWAKRKPGPATAVALAGLMLVGAAVGMYLLQGAYRETKTVNGQLHQSNADLAAQKREADLVLALALHDLEKFTFEASNKLSDVPNTEDIRRDLLDDGRRSLAAIDRLRPKDFSVREYAMVGYDKLAEAENRLGRFPAALESQRRALQLAEELAAEHPNDSTLPFKQANAHAKIAALAARVGQPEEAVKHRTISEDMVRALLRETPDDADLLKMSATPLAREYGGALTAKDAIRAEAAVRAYAAVYARRAALAPADAAMAMDAADAQMMVASFLSSHNKAAEAAALLAEIEKALAARPEPPSLRARKIRANVEWTRGSVLGGLNKNPEAEAAYVAAAREFESLVSDYPKTRDLRLTLAQVYWYHGQLWAFSNQPTKAKPPLLKAKALLEQFAADKTADDQSRAILGFVDELLKLAK